MKRHFHWKQYTLDLFEWVSTEIYPTILAHIEDIYDHKPHLFCGEFIIFINLRGWVISVGELKICCEIPFSLQYLEKCILTRCPWRKSERKNWIWEEHILGKNPPPHFCFCEAFKLISFRNMWTYNYNPYFYFVSFQLHLVAFIRLKLPMDTSR